MATYILLTSHYSITIQHFISLLLRVSFSSAAYTHGIAGQKLSVLTNLPAPAPVGGGGRGTAP